MLWQGAKWRILKNFKLQNEECHDYAWICMVLGQKLYQHCNFLIVLCDVDF
jgi:hypothetical protein